MQFLIGKTILSVDNIGKLDLYEDDTYVSEVYKIVCSDGSEFYVSSNAGDVSDAYCEIYQMNKNLINSIILKK